MILHIKIRQINNKEISKITNKSFFHNKRLLLQKRFFCITLFLKFLCILICFLKTMIKLHYANIMQYNVLSMKCITTLPYIKIKFKAIPFLQCTNIKFKAISDLFHFFLDVMELRKHILCMSILDICSTKIY